MPPLVFCIRTADWIFISGYTSFFNLNMNMYSNLTLYYLNQMGICPWINKENSLESIEKSSTVCPLKLVVLVSNELKGKAESLFKHMMTYLNIIKG